MAWWGIVRQGWSFGGWRNQTSPARTRRFLHGCGLAAFASRPLSLTFTKRFGWTLLPTCVRSCQAKRLEFSRWKCLTGLTRDKALRVRIQKALAIDYLRNEMRMLGAASVGPVDMGTQVMSVARVGQSHRAEHHNTNATRCFRPERYW
jgi:hypothetical protein